MPSLIYNSCLGDAFRAQIDFKGDSFKAMLVTSDYRPDKDSHTRRSHVTGEVSGAGYSPGGISVSVSLAKGVLKDTIDIQLGEAAWSKSTITARGLVYYKARGGSPVDDELVSYIDFGKDIISTDGDFDVTASTLRFQNS